MIQELLSGLPLFDGIEAANDLERLVGCLNPSVETYSKNDLIYSAGERVTQLGIVLSGEVRLFAQTYNGQIENVETLGAGELFGDICAGIAVNEMTIRAAGASTVVLFIEYRKLTALCQTVCPRHITLLCNLVRLYAVKARALEEKLRILQKRGTREKLLAYLHLQAKKAGSTKFSIPLNRAGLADYLCADRSAMSRELCAMRDDGMLEFYKNSFILMDED